MNNEVSLQRALVFRLAFQVFLAAAEGITDDDIAAFDLAFIVAERPEQQAELAASMPSGATIWHVCRGCNINDVASGFPGAAIDSEMDTDSGWRLFEVTP